MINATGGPKWVERRKNDDDNKTKMEAGFNLKQLTITCIAFYNEHKLCFPTETNNLSVCQTSTGA
jgi:hypothetical protein